MKRERMDIEEAAAFLAELPLAEQVDLTSPFPRVSKRRYGRGLDPRIQKWIRRIRQATAEQTLACYRDPDSPTRTIYYRQDDLVRWVRKVFPRQEALHAS